MMVVAMVMEMVKKTMKATKVMMKLALVTVVQLIVNTTKVDRDFPVAHCSPYGHAQQSTALRPG